MPYNNNSCNHSYSQPSYSHPYVHHQNAHAYNHGYPSQHPALTYPGYGYSGGYSGQSYCAPRYSSPSYASPSYGTPNVFSIIKTSPIDTDDNVCALNSYDTLCLDSTGSEDHLTITGDKTNKKVTFALKNLIFGSEDSSVATNTNYVMGATDRLVTAPTLTGTATYQTLSANGDVVAVNSSLVKVSAAAATADVVLQVGNLEGQRLTLANVGTQDFDFSSSISNINGAATAQTLVGDEVLELIWLKNTAGAGAWYVTAGMLS